MWKLRSVKKEHIEQFILVNEECVVGRKGANLMIVDDPSISRKHASLYIQHDEANVLSTVKPSCLFLRDENSKYGTFVNNQRITSPVQLRDNDVVKFGQFQSEYKVQNIPLVVTTSCLDNPSKKQLKDILHILGGHLLPEWQLDCTHLVMSQIKVTVKALFCLASTKPIVTPTYFEKLRESISSSQALLSCNRFIPPLGEPMIDKDAVSFDIDPRRRQVFSNKNFIFFDEKQYHKLKLGITLGSGKASLYKDSSENLEAVISESSCVVQPAYQASQQLNSKLLHVSSILKKKQMKMIPESDIGLAVVHCSTEKFCNPSCISDSGGLDYDRIQSSTLNEQVFAPDSQINLRSTRNQTNVASGSGLNLSSFHKGGESDMEVSEIPLSAQIKKELESIFSLNDDDDDISMDEPTRAKSPPRVPVKENLPESSGSSNQSPVQNACPIPKEKRLLKTEEASPVVTNGTGSLHARENGFPKSGILSIDKKSDEMEDDDDGFPPIKEEEIDVTLPRNLMKIDFAPLIFKRPAVVDNSHICNKSAKNFKKFKKVLPKRSRVLPRIIGAHELVAFDRVGLDSANDMWNEPVDEEPAPVRGKFDWDS